MSSQDECLSQKTAFHTAGSHKPIEVKLQSLARVAQIMSTLGQKNEDSTSEARKDPSEYGTEFDGDEIDADLVFSTVPQRSSILTTTQIHFDEIDDDEMRRFAESLEQQETRMDGNEQVEDDLDDDQLCQDYATKMQTPTKSVQIETNKRKQRCIEDLDALLNDNDDENDENQQRTAERQQQMSPVFKKKP